MTPTPAYAVAHLRTVDLGPAIIEYLERIDATLAPYGGRFLVHGGPIDALEGSWPGDVVIIAFPSREAALAWYDSPGYRAILPLRTENSDSSAALLTGVPTGYRAADKITSLLP